MINFGQLWRMAIWQYAGFVINFLVQIALTALLPTSYFGYMATLQVSMELLTGITTLSFHGTLYRTYNEDIEKTTNHALFLGILQAAITLTLSGGIAYYFYTNSQFDWKAILFCLLYQVSIIANNFKMIIYTALEKHKTFVRNSQIESSINLMIGIVLVAWAWYFPSVEVLMTKVCLPSITLSIIYIIFYYYKGFRLTIPHIDKALLKVFLKNSFNNYFARTADSLYNRIDILLAKYFFNDLEIGIYERIKYFAGLPNYLLNSTNSRILLVIYGAANKQLHVLQRVNFITFTTNFFLYLELFIFLHLLSYFINNPVLQAIFPLYLSLWYFGGVNTVRNNVRIYLFIKHHVFRNAIKLFTVPTIIFCVMVASIYVLKSPINLPIWAFLYSLSQIASFVLLPKKLYWLYVRRYTQYYWYWGKKKYKYFRYKKSSI
ncbi:MAG: oligosaccharide flippase family protein [Thermoflexibacteraceae bacterium]